MKNREIWGKNDNNNNISIYMIYKRKFFVFFVLTQVKNSTMRFSLIFLLQNNLINFRVITLKVFPDFNSNWIKVIFEFKNFRLADVTDFQKMKKIGRMRGQCNIEFYHKKLVYFRCNIFELRDVNMANYPAT